MGVAGALQVTLQAVSQDAKASSWTLPAFLVSMRSHSVMMRTGDDLVIIRLRIAEALNIQDNDTVDFLVNEIGETWHLKVKICDDTTSDIFIHDLFTLGLAKSYSAFGEGGEVELTSGTILRNPSQAMWAGTRIIPKKGSAVLYFDGANKKNPHCPCGYGFHIGTDLANKSNLV
eukprot:441725_1